MQNATIEIEQLRKTYRDGIMGRKQFEALKGVDLQVHPGEIFGLLGPNGAGKTTMVKILLGIVRRTKGSATLLGLPAGDRRSRRRVGYLPENLRIPRHHNANTALDLYGQMSGLSSAEIRSRRGPILERVGLADRAKDSVKKYSKGMLQRLGLAQCMLHQPEVVFLDEPTDGLDPVGRSDVRTILTELKSEGKTVFLNSHLLQEVEMICDRVAILHKGELRGIGTVAQLNAHRPQGTEIIMELGGPREAILSVLGETAATWLEPIAQDHFKWTANNLEQDAVDGTVDRLRGASVSLISLTPRKLTLEDAFLKLVSS